MSDFGTFANPTPIDVVWDKEEKVGFEGVIKKLTAAGLEPAISWFVVRRDAISPRGR